jgi:hypothetical protein
VSIYVWLNNFSLSLFLDRLDRKERALCRIHRTQGKISLKKLAAQFETTERVVSQVTENASGEDNADSDLDYVPARVREKYQLPESAEDDDAFSDGEPSGPEPDLTRYKGK